MLSDKVLASTKDASHYFMEQDNYYMKGGKEVDISLWRGKGAEALGLEGIVNREVFENLLNGKLPNGNQLGKMVEGQISHRPGFDLTFSAPKSVSILAEVGGDERVHAAHEKAVTEALSYIERSCAQARKTQSGVTTYENTGNVIAATFRHDVSRELDPHLHSHCVVMNITERRDGQWRALASDMNGYGEGTNGFIERVRKDKVYFGNIYRSALAYELKEIGYNIVKTHQDGRFEVEGVSPEVIKHFSRRRADIEAFLKEKNWTGAKASSFATLETRVKKQAMDRDTLHQEWLDRSTSLQFDVKAFVEQAVEKKQSSEIASGIGLNKGEAKTVLFNTKNDLVTEALDFAISHHSERDVHLSKHRIINTAVSQLLGDIKVSEITQALDMAIESKQLIPVDVVGKETYYTTTKLVETEKNLLGRIADNQYKVLPWVGNATLNKFFQSDASLTHQQKQVMAVLTSSVDRFTVLTGMAASGKTTVLRNLAELAKEERQSVLYLTPSQAQSKQWGVANVKAKTITGYLSEAKHAIEQKKAFFKPSIILVDHAQLVSLDQLNELTKLAERNNARITFAGDDRSTLGMSAGSPFAQMIKHGVKTVRLTDDRRAIEAERKSAIQDTLAGNIDQAFEKINHRLLECRDKDDRFAKIAHHYVSLPEADKKQTLVLMSTKQEVAEINHRIRDGLKEKGTLGRQEVTLSVYLPQALSNTEMASAKNYQEGWYLRFNQSASKSKIGQYDYWQIKSIEKEKNQFVLVNTKGRTTIWSPKELSAKVGKVEVFKREERQVAVGETLQVVRANRDKKFYTGETLQVVGINDRWLKVANSQGATTKLNSKEIRYNHLDYGYSSTPQRSHHLNVKTIIANQDSFKGQVSQRQFYKLIAQASDEAWLYTDNKQALLEKVKSTTGDKLTAIEALLEGKVGKKTADVFVVNPDNPLASQISALKNSLSDVINELYKEASIAKNSAVTKEEIATEAARYAMAQLGEREAAFTHKELVAAALKQSLGNINPAQIEKAILEIHGESGLVRGKAISTGAIWTTQAAIEMERDVIHVLKEGVDRVSPILSEEKARTLLEDTFLGKDQQQAAVDILTTSDRFTLLQAPAGSGKTTLMEFVKGFAEASSEGDYRIVGVAPSDTAVGELNKRGVPTQTMASFLMEARTQYETKAIPDLSKTIFILDESSMVSTRGFLEFSRYITDTNARCVPIGDKDQLASPEAGKPFELGQVSGIKTSYLTEVFRQEADRVALKSAVSHVMNKEYAESLADLNKQTELSQEPFSLEAQNKKGLAHKAELPRIIEIKSDDERLGAMVDDFLARDQTRRDNTILIVPKNSDRNLANELLREGLKAEGLTAKQGVVVDVLTPRHLTYVDASRAANYVEGDVLRFNKSLPQVGITRLSYLTVEKADILSNTLLLTNSDKSKRFIWELPTHEVMPKNLVEVYKKEAREACNGDVIRWTRSDKTQGFKNGIKGTVIDTAEHAISLRLDDGTVKVIDTKNSTHKHWDYGYAVTAYGSQGSTANEVITNEDSKYKLLTTQREFYVVITRAKRQVTLYTDDAKALQKQIASATGNKYSALEVIGEMPNKADSRNPSLSLSKTKASKVKASQVSAINKEQIESNRATKETKPQVVPANKSSLQPPNVRQIIEHKGWDANEIKAKLTDQTEHIVRTLLGEPKKIAGDSWRYGTKSGSLVVTVNGDDRGLWHDFQTGEGGTLLTLIAKEFGHNTKESFGKTLDVAAGMLGLSDNLKVSSDKKPLLTKKSAPQPQSPTFTPKQLKSIAFAQKLAGESSPIKGSLAEKYLREHRGISGDLPSNLRFHPGVYSKINDKTAPALVAIATNSKGDIQAIQATFLDPKTANKASLAVNKQSFGPTKGAMVWLQEGKGTKSPVICAEGVETGLSLKEADPNKGIAVTLGKSNFLNIKTDAKVIIIALDNDGRNPATETIVNNAIQRLQDQGKTVYTNQPSELKKDFNDVLKEQGVNAVRQYIADAREMPMQSPRDERMTPKQFDKAFNDVSLKHEERYKSADERPISEARDSRAMTDKIKTKTDIEMDL